MQIPRNIYLDRLIRKKQNHLVKVVTGMRRCGKSYLLFELFKQHLLEEGVPEDHIIEMVFDAFENRQYCNPDVFFPYLMDRISADGEYYILLDEVQLLGEFEAVLNSLLRRKNVDIYVTGSNARFLSKDVITEFRGRGDEIHMYPLSFAEYMTAYDGSVSDAWKDFVVYGSLPMIFDFPIAEDKTVFLKALLDETYLSDIVGRHKIRNKAEFSELVNILSSAVGSLTNPAKLSSTFHSVKKKTISPATIQNYIDYLCDAFLIDKAIRYDVKGKRYIDTPSKYYFTDLGLRNARLNFRQIEETHAMENVIFNELKIRGWSVDVGVITQNFKNTNGNGARRQLEIDFVCNKGSKRCYIQSAFAMPDTEKEEQEQRSLLLTGDFFKKIIITKDIPAPHYNDNGVLIMNVFDFLLDAESLEK